METDLPHLRAAKDQACHVTKDRADVVGVRNSHIPRPPIPIRPSMLPAAPCPSASRGALVKANHGFCSLFCSFKTTVFLPRFRCIFTPAISSENPERAKRLFLPSAPM